MRDLTTCRRAQFRAKAAETHGLPRGDSADAEEIDRCFVRVIRCFDASLSEEKMLEELRQRCIKRQMQSSNSKKVL